MRGFLAAMSMSVTILSGCGRALHDAPLPAPSTDPFAPATLRVHPLTHVDAGPIAGAPPGSSAVILHLEVKDRFGDPVKALGVLNVELYKPIGGVSPGIESQALTWTVPGFDDPERNSGRFDQATRTYRVPLVCPGWVAEWFSKDGAVRGDAPAWLKVRAVLTMSEERGPETEGRTRYLDGEYVLQ